MCFLHVLETVIGYIADVVRFGCAVTKSRDLSMQWQVKNVLNHFSMARRAATINNERH